MNEKTYIEKLTEETLRPVMAAYEQMSKEIETTMNVPQSPWQILNKPYDELTEQEVVALFDIYHQEGEPTPCPMCDWVARMELMKSRQEKTEGL